ncbi:MAG: hypothetical protein R2838_24340 [Caldilineaceae bacterium]
MLARLLQQPQAALARAELRAACALKSDSTFHTLAGKSLVTLSGDEGRAGRQPGGTPAALLAAWQRQVCAGPGGVALLDRPLWKSTLAAETEADLRAAAGMQADGLIALRERIRFRDPLAGQRCAHTRRPHVDVRAAARVGDGAHACIRRRRPTQQFLLHGVTGSGKELRFTCGPSAQHWPGTGRHWCSCRKSR